MEVLVETDREGDGHQHIPWPLQEVNRITAKTIKFCFSTSIGLGNSGRDFLTLKLMGTQIAIATITKYFILQYDASKAIFSIQSHRIFTEV